MKKVAIFDFDHTLIKGDSLWPFLIYACGPFTTFFALLEGLLLFMWVSLCHKKHESMRTFVKSHLLRRLLKGKRPSELNKAILKTKAWQKINVPVLQALHEHKENGTTIVIASGGLDLYLPDLLQNTGYDALICTSIGSENGVLTGEMSNGNCVRLRKAELVGAWLNAHGPFDESYGYGNYPHDIPMLNYVQHRIIIS